MIDDPRAGLLAQLEPVLEFIAQQLAHADIASPTGALHLTARLSSRWPATGPAVAALEASLREGVDNKWLCDRGEPGARFCRLAKASPETRDFSLDVVSLEGAALEHAHPAGEITLAVPATNTDHEARFDGHPRGWIVLPAGSRHVPTVTGGRMILLYALPGGAITWNPA